jgi:hypothetical protein
VGSNPTNFTFIDLVNYGISLNSIWIIVGQKAHSDFANGGAGTNDSCVAEAETKCEA